MLPTYVFADEQREDRELASALTVINENRPVAPDDVSQARSKYGSFFTRQLFVEQISTRFGLVSFAADPCNPLMLTHYTVDGSGFVIGYDADVISGLVGMRGWLKQSRLQGQASLHPRAKCRGHACFQSADTAVDEEQPLVS